MTFSGISRKVQRSAFRILPGEGVGIETSVSAEFSVYLPRIKGYEKRGRHKN